SESTEVEHQQLFSISSQREALQESSRNLSMKQFSPQWLCWRAHQCDLALTLCSDMRPSCSNCRRQEPHMALWAGSYIFGADRKRKIWKTASGALGKDPQRMAVHGLAGAGLERRIQSASLSVCLTGLQDLNTQQHCLAKMRGQFNSS
ncbi:hypothetical protein JOQ06_018714, partial [Pogonophryne albipinna]